MNPYLLKALALLKPIATYILLHYPDEPRTCRSCLYWASGTGECQLLSSALHQEVSGPIEVDSFVQVPEDVRDIAPYTQIRLRHSLITRHDFYCGLWEKQSD